MRFIEKVVNNIKNHRQKCLMNKKFQKAEIVHIMYNDKFNKPFVDFLNKNFDDTKHLVLCKRAYNDIATPFPSGPNVIELDDLSAFNLESKNIKKIICHSLYTEGIVDFLYRNPSLLKKSYWVMWGGDLYQAPRDEVNDFVRENFKGYAAVMHGDITYLQSKYPNKGSHFFITYISPITTKLLESNRISKKDRKTTHIQVNNSCDETVLEMLDILSKFKDEDIKITTVLSYGNLKYKDEIIQKGKEIFANKFQYIEDLMSPDLYVKHLADIDVLVLNQNRQQGGGNAICSMSMGTKVFIKSEITTYKEMQERGVIVFDTNKIPDMDFQEFVENKDIANNIEKLKRFFDKDEIIAQWERVWAD